MSALGINSVVRSVFRLTMPPLSLIFIFLSSPPKTLSFSRIPLNLSQKNNDLGLIHRWTIMKFYLQKMGCYNNEIFSPVVRRTSTCVLLDLVTTLDMELEHLDVKTVFLHGRLEEDILMQQLEGFKVKGKENFVYTLKRSFYGLK